MEKKESIFLILVHLIDMDFPKNIENAYIFELFVV